MKKNTLHKVMATALVGAMAMSTLTGCGSSADNTTADAGTKESVAESSVASTDAGASTAVAGIDGWEAFADNVTLQIPVYDRGSSGNGCSDVENNYWTNWVQENFGDKYNITVEYVGITRSDVMTDYAMLAASQSLPTICMEYEQAGKLAGRRLSADLRCRRVQADRSYLLGDHGRARQRCLHQAG